MMEFAVSGFMYVRRLFWTCAKRLAACEELEKVKEKKSCCNDGKSRVLRGIARRAE